MTKKRLSRILLLSILILSCSAVSNIMKDEKFNNTAESFHYAMRWSDLKTAVTFRQETVPGEISSSLEPLKRIKVTSFTVIETIPNENKTEILQIAEIQYYKSDDMKEKTIVSHLLWEYDPKRENWYIVKGWPEFQ